MKKNIEGLSIELLNDAKALGEIDKWLSVMNRPNGWHYDLDHIWVLQKLEEYNIKPGATILDAGAGYGILQYILAARGYNVISLDFSPRSVPKEANGIFTIVGDGDVSIEYDHPYMHFMSYSKKFGERFKSFSNKLHNVTAIEFVQKLKKLGLHLLHSQKTKGYPNKYKNIRFLRAPFHKIPLESESIDAVVSISAIEHADINIFNENIYELTRVIKCGGGMFMTTGATTESANTYNNDVRGWCFSTDWLAERMGIGYPAIEADKIISEIIQSQRVKDRLDPYYWARKGSMFHKKNMTNLPYYPIGLVFLK